MYILVSFLIYPEVFDELNSFTIIPLFIILCDMWILLEYVKYVGMRMFKNGKKQKQKNLQLAQSNSCSY